jgi:hypothetical protein
MKKVLISVFIVAAGIAVFSACNKNKPYITTNNPIMTADVDSFKFIASAVTPATIDTQLMDTSTTLVITGYSSDRVAPYDKIILSIANFKGATGTFSVVQGEAGALYYHSGVQDTALGGIVSITEVTSTVISGYFSFNTKGGVALTNGKYTVGLP